MGASETPRHGGTWKQITLFLNIWIEFEQWKIYTRVVLVIKLDSSLPRISSISIHKTSNKQNVQILKDLFFFSLRVFSWKYEVTSLLETHVKVLNILWFSFEYLSFDSIFIRFILKVLLVRLSGIISSEMKECMVIVTFLFSILKTCFVAQISFQIPTLLCWISILNFIGDKKNVKKAKNILFTQRMMFKNGYNLTIPW